jgi:hypothetical protein
VGAGAGLAYPAIGVLDLTKSSLPTGHGEDFDEEADGSEEATTDASAHAEEALTIPEAKRRLAVSLGVPESAIKITIEH